MLPSNARDQEVARRVLRELGAVRVFENIEWLTSDEDRRALARVRKLCGDIALNARGRITT